MLFRPSESSKRIVDFYRRYLLTTFSTNNEKYNKQLKEALEKEGTIAEGPYLSMSDPYEKGKTLILTSFLYTICKKYNISADYLLGKIDEPKYLK